MTDPKDEQDWEQYQQTEIDGAKEKITTRMEHIGSSVADGLLEGELLNEHQNTRLQAYLEGYADALSYSAKRVDRIDTLVNYAVDQAENAANGGDSQ